MQLHDYLTVVRKRWVSILLTAALAIAGAAAATLLTVPTYRASSQVFVSSSSGGTTQDLLQGSDFARQRVTSYTTMVTSPRVLGPVIKQLGLATTSEQLAKSITADSPLDTVLINITVSNKDPKVASAVANATAESLGTQVGILDKPVGDLPSPVHISFLQMANVPTAPAAPSPKFNLGIGLLLGLTLGFLLAILREILDTRVKSEADVRNVTNAPVLAGISYDDEAAQHPLIVQTGPHSHRSEAFRRLRTNLQFLDVVDRPRSIVVTSSLSSEGKSTTAINLAITLANAGSRVVLVDADLRWPSVAGYLALEGEVGLSTVLNGQADLPDAVQPWGDGDRLRPWGEGSLHVLPSGQIPPNPSEMLGSQSMVEVLEQLTSHFDIVIIDTPPLLQVTDASIMAKISDGALVVVAADRIVRQQLAEGLGSLQNVGALVLGVVLNRLAPKQTDAYARDDYARAPATGMPQPGPSETAVTERTDRLPVPVGSPSAGDE